MTTIDKKDLPRGIFIQCFDMPKSCKKCPFKTKYKEHSICMFHNVYSLSFYIEYSELDFRPDICPLQEVK